MKIFAIAALLALGLLGPVSDSQAARVRAGVIVRRPVVVRPLVVRPIVVARPVLFFGR